MAGERRQRRPGATHGQGIPGPGPEEHQDRSQPPPGHLTGLPEWSAPTRFILVAPGAKELPRQFTEPRWREYAANADLELPTDRGDLGLVQGNLRNAPNRHQDPSWDSQDPWQWSGPTRFILVAPGARELPRQFTEPRWRDYAANTDLELPTERGDLGLTHLFVFFPN